MNDREAADGGLGERHHDGDEPGEERQRVNVGSTLPPVALLQKAHKVVGRFYYLELEKSKQGYLRYIPPTLASLRRALARLPEYANLREILARHFPELT